MSARHNWANVFIVQRPGPDGQKGSMMNSMARCSTGRGIGSVRLYLALGSPSHAEVWLCLSLTYVLLWTIHKLTLSSIQRSMQWVWLCLSLTSVQHWTQIDSVTIPTHTLRLFIFTFFKFYWPLFYTEPYTNWPCHYACNCLSTCRPV